MSPRAAARAAAASLVAAALAGCGPRPPAAPAGGATPSGGAPGAVAPVGAGSPAPGVAPAGGPIAAATAGPTAQAAMAQIRQLMQMNRPEEARTLAANAVAADPGVMDLRVMYGAILWQNKGQDEALAVFETGLAMDPNHLPTLLFTGLAHEELGHFEQALGFAQRYLALKAGDPTAAGLAARCLDNLGRTADGIALLEPLRSGGDADILAALGLLYRHAGRDDDAAKTLQAALLANPKQATALINLGQILVRQGKQAEGEALLKQHAEMAKEQDQLDFLEFASRLEGAGTQNLLMLGDQRARQGDMAGALEAFRQASAHNPRDPRPVLGMAAMSLELGRIDDAATFAEQASALDGTNPEGQLLLGAARARQGQAEAAEAAFKRAEALSPWGFDQYAMAGDAWFDAGALDRADAMYSRARQIAPGQPRVLFKLGLIRYLQNRFTDALSLIDAAAAIEPTSGDDRLAAAIIYDRLGKPDESNLALQGAVSAFRYAGVFDPAAVARRLAVFPGSEATLERFKALAAAPPTPQP